MAKFRKKPVVIEATQWHKNGDNPEDGPADREGKIIRYYRHPDVPGGEVCAHCMSKMHDHGWIDTLEGGHNVCPGDWVITGVKGEVYPCKPDIFEATYDRVDEPKQFPVVESGVTCPARVEQYGPWEKKEGLDSWERRGPDKCCSFCGSFHPEDFLALVKKGADPDSAIRIEPATGKSKWYVHRPEVPISAEGGLKFYGYHARGWDREINEYLPEALRISREKFDKDFRRRKAEHYPNP